MMIPRRKLYPLPGVVRKPPRGKSWRINELEPPSLFSLMMGAPKSSCTDISAARMTVPLDDSSRSLVSRVHEMLHARFSPRHVPLIEGVRRDAILAAEDSRLAMIATTLDVPHPNDDQTTAETQEIISGTAKKMPTMTRAEAMAARRAIGLCVLSHGYTPAGIAAYTVILRTNPGAQPWDQLELVRALRSGFQVIREMRGHYRNPRCMRTLARKFERLFPIKQEQEPDEEHERATPISSAERFALEYNPSLEIDTAPLCERLVPRTIRPVIRHQDFGAILRAPHRWAIDRAVFRTSRMRPSTGGTILIDGSASMELQQADLERLLMARPAATIAVYNGHAKRSMLRILARHGRRVVKHNVAPPLNGGHNYDAGPVNWLTRQDGPRWFITDMGFHGLTGRPGYDGDRYRAGISAMMRRGAVQQVYSIDSFLVKLRAQASAGCRAAMTAKP